MNFVFKSSRLTLLAFLLIATASINLSSELRAQDGFAGPRDITDTSMRLTGDDPTSVDYRFFPFPQRTGYLSGGFGIRHVNNGGRSIFAIADNAADGSLGITLNGVGIGVDGYLNAQEAVNAPLHVKGGFGGAFANAQILVEDQNGTTDYRSLLRLRNNGPIAVNFENTNGQTWRIDSNNDNLNFNDTTNGNTVPFIIRTQVPSNALVLGPNGTGIGTNAPQAALHVSNANSGFGNNSALIENVFASALPTNLMTLQSAGPVSLTMADSNAGSSFSIHHDFGGFFVQEDSSINIPLFISGNAANNLLNLEGGGVGINTSRNINTPVAALLHLTADGSGGTLSNGESPLIRGTVNIAGDSKSRELVSLENNGPVLMRFRDTRTNQNSPYFIESSDERLSFFKSKEAPIWAALNVHGDGFVRYTIGKAGETAQPNMVVTPNGNVRVIGRTAAQGFDNNGNGRNLEILGAIDINNPQNNRPGNLLVTGDATVRGAINGRLSSDSDRNLKTNINLVDADDVLAKVVDLPISTWNYKVDEKGATHMGPMAQDFRAAFNLGTDDKTIFSIDKDGVALAAIQGLNKKVESKDKEIAELKATTEAQSEVIEELMARLEQLEAAVAPSKQ